MRFPSKIITSVVIFGLLYLTVDFIKYKSKAKQGNFSARYNIDIPTIPRHRFGLLHPESNQAHPKIIHQTYKEEILPTTLKPWMQSWLKFNPDWQYWFWTDEDIRLFVSTRYPNFLYYFDLYPESIYRSDVFRYFALYEYGGVYADCDMECLKPLNEAIKEHDCIIGLEPEEHAWLLYFKSRLLGNAYLSCRPRHPFYEYVINMLMTHTRWLQRDVNKETGPTMLDTAYENYIVSHPKQEAPYLAVAHLHQVLPDLRNERFFKESCRSFVLGKEPARDAMCKRFLADKFLRGPVNTSYTIHHWTHMWLDNGKDKYGAWTENTTFNIKNLFDNIPRPVGDRK